MGNEDLDDDALLGELEMEANMTPVQIASEMKSQID
jgi:hypothetical protein